MNVLEELVSGFSEESCEQILQEYCDWGLMSAGEMLADKLGDDTLLKQSAKEFIQSKSLPESYTTVLCMELHDAVYSRHIQTKVENSINRALVELDEQLSDLDYDNVEKLVRSYHYDLPVDKIQKVMLEAVDSGLISKNAEKVIQKCIGESH